MGFKIGNFNFSPPKINLPKFQAPKISLPKPQQIFGLFKGNSQPAKPQSRPSAPKPNLLQRGLNWGKSFVQNPVKATQRLQQKVTNKVVSTTKYVAKGTVSNTKKAFNQAGKQFTRFENWADKGIKNNNNWAQQNRNSKNLLNRVTANANLGFTKVAKGTNDVINTSSTYYRGLRKSNNWLVKGAGYAGGLATSIGRGLASPVTFADPRLSGKQRTGQVVDGVLSYIPVGKVLGLGGKAVKAVGGPILRFGGKIVKPIGGQISQRAPWLIKGGAKVVAGSKNVAGNIAASKGSQFVKNKLVTPFVNRIAKPTVQGFNNINNALNRKLTFKDVRNLPQTIGNGFNKLRDLGKGVKPTSVKGNPLRNINVGTRQRLANSGSLPMTARANAKKGVNNTTNQVVEGNKRTGFQVAEKTRTASVNNGAKNVRGRTNDLGFDGQKLYGQKLKSSEVKQIEGFLKQKGVELRRVPKNGSHTFPDGLKIRDKADALFAIDPKTKKPIMVLRDKASFLSFFHEYKHFEQFQKMGVEKWAKIGGGGTLGGAAKEQFVFNQVNKNKHLFTREELRDALAYANRERAKVGLKPINIDYSNIPAIRPEVKNPVEELLKTKSFKNNQ
jgi:Metallopeptidase toxin 4